MSAEEPLPYWLVNVPRNKWPSECPEYLKNLSDKDVKHLAVRDEDYHWLTWAEVKRNVATNQLDAFFRLPSDLRRYRKYCFELERDYGSVMNFMLWHRLNWQSLDPQSRTPFECKEDYKILRNDWPYGIDSKIVHLVVWTKTEFEADPISGTLTPGAFKQIDDFVQTTFADHLPAGNLIWFKNPISLRSVRAVEHFHVMPYDPQLDFVTTITNGDVPMSDIVPRDAGNEFT